MDFVTAFRDAKSIGFSPPRIGCQRSGFAKRISTIAVKRPRRAPLPGAEAGQWALTQSINSRPLEAARAAPPTAMISSASAIERREKSARPTLASSHTSQPTSSRPIGRANAYPRSGSEAAAEPDVGNRDQSEHDQCRHPDQHRSPLRQTPVKHPVPRPVQRSRERRSSRRQHELTAPSRHGRGSARPCRPRPAPSAPPRAPTGQPASTADHRAVGRTRSVGLPIAIPWHRQKVPHSAQNPRKRLTPPRTLGVTLSTPRDGRLPLSVVVPTLRECRLSRALQALAQNVDAILQPTTMRLTEVLVVDDGSNRIGPRRSFTTSTASGAAEPAPQPSIGRGPPFVPGCSRQEIAPGSGRPTCRRP